ncbi:hypothetical protein, partial [Stutzerimonas kunmingensis]|uniref:hypothetical protein n=1 Tax=Stutzerimonas kunmingensis TaxID=1211807 RepID=UPI00241C6677
RGFAFGAEKGIDLWEEHLARAYEVPSANPSIALLHCCIAALLHCKLIKFIQVGCFGVVLKEACPRQPRSVQS